MMEFGEPKGLHCDVALILDRWHVALIDNDIPISKSEFETFEEVMESVRDDLTKGLE